MKTDAVLAGLCADTYHLCWGIGLTLCRDVLVNKVGHANGGPQPVPCLPLGIHLGASIHISRPPAVSQLACRASMTQYAFRICSSSDPHISVAELECLYPTGRLNDDWDG